MFVEGETLLEASGYYVKVYIRDELYVQVVTDETLEFSTYHGIRYWAVGSGYLSKLEKVMEPFVRVLTSRLQRLRQFGWLMN
ncbi:MAG: hypothetical protein QMC95_17935 [Desulfitobacteriaceae bacterium]|nr:hypothetical protein [Desulfitobacteriaceae bacterium]MDI6916064.1 hypothetical protein [Desulfitobacteriaceae bacterium]